MKKIAILKETINGENRVILLPNDIDELRNTNYMIRSMGQ